MKTMMAMRSRKAVFLAACVLAAAPAVVQAQAKFDSYVSIGDSLAAGFSSGSLVETHQRNSVPALLATQAGVGANFQQPTVAEPGLPPELSLVSLVPGPIVAPKSTTGGVPTNLTLPRPYNNLAVPGATLHDALTRITDGGGFHDLILRGIAPQLGQAVALQPTFITLWIGNNDVLGAALSGRAIPGVTLTPPEDFRADYGTLVAALKSNTTAQIVAANLPDVTSIPFVSTIPPIVVNPATQQPVIVNGNTVPLIGPQGPLPANAFVLLSASSLLSQGIGIPAALGGQGTPLPDEVILDANEAALIQQYVAQDNQAIADICGAAGIPVLDFHGILQTFKDSGRDVGGIHLTAAYLTGGVFSYDGVHPTDIGNGILANEWISVINSKLGASLPLVDLSPLLGVGGSSRRSAQSASPELTREAVQNLLSVFRPIR